MWFEMLMVDGRLDWYRLDVNGLFLFEQGIRTMDLL